MSRPCLSLPRASLKPALAVALGWLCACAPAVAQEAASARAQQQQQRAVQRFDILQYTVQGNTVLPEVEIEKAVYPFLGEQKTLADVEGAKKALEKAYQDKGWLSVVVTVPPQTSRNGEIVLEVIEARVDTLRISGTQYHLPSDIRAATPSLAPGQVPNFTAVQADLGRVQGGGDVQVTPLISAGADPRKLDVDLKVQDELPLHGSVEVNNKQTYNTERGRIEAGLRYQNLWQREHTLGVNWIYSPQAPKQANTLVLNYSLPLRSERPSPEGDDRLSFVLVSSRSDTPTSLGGATVVRGETYGVRWRQPLPGLADDKGFFHGWTLGADLKHTRDANQAVAGFTTQNPSLHYPVLSVGYDLVSLGRDTRFTSFDMTLTLGSSGLGSRDVNCSGLVADQFDCKRQGASADFQTLRFNLEHRRPLMLGSKAWTLRFKAQAQFASGRLVSAEQFGAGGVDSVRGYYEYEQVGDQGGVLRSELLTPIMKLGEHFSGQGVLFYDRAALRIIDPLPAEQSWIGMASWGLGWEMQAPYGLLLRAGFAMPLLKTLKADSSGTLVPVSGESTKNRRRFDLSLRSTF